MSCDIQLQLIKHKNCSSQSITILVVTMLGMHPPTPPHPHLGSKSSSLFITQVRTDLTKMNLFCKLFIGCWSKPGQTSCQLSVTAYSPIHFLLISPTFSLHKPLLGSFVLLHTHSLYKNLRPALFLLLCSGFSPF